MRALPLVLAFAAALACASRQPEPASARRTTLSLKHLHCSTCGNHLAEELAAEPGVQSVRFDRKRAVLYVLANPSVDALARARSLKGEQEFDVVEGGADGDYAPWPSAGAGDVLELNHGGSDVADLRAHLVSGKVTVFDFGAIWCEPCRVLDEHMLEVSRKRTDVAYRKLDVDDFDTPLARHYLKGVPKLPYVIVYDKHGRVKAEITGLNVKGLDQAIDAGAK